jgi:hypothetical protein
VNTTVLATHFAAINACTLCVGCAAKGKRDVLQARFWKNGETLLHSHRMLRSLQTRPKLAINCTNIISKKQLDKDAHQSRALQRQV